MTRSGSTILISPAELQKAADTPQPRHADLWLAALDTAKGPSDDWYRALCQAVRLLPDRPVCVELLSGLPMFLAKQPVGVEVYNDARRTATDFFRCLRTPSLYAHFVWLCRAYQHLTLSPTKLVSLLHTIPSRLVRTYCWYQLADGFVSNSQTGGLWRNRAVQYKVFDVHDPWTKDLYDFLADVHPRLPELHGRLMRIQYEENSVEKMLELYDAPDTLFWVDGHPDLLRRHATNPFDLFERLDEIQGSVALLWWKAWSGKSPENQRWTTKIIPGTGLTLASKIV